jgi:hypothetical protein
VSTLLGEDPFQFFSEHGEGSERSQARFTIVESANGKVSTLLEETKAGGPWVVVEKVDYVRTRPSALMVLLFPRIRVRLCPGKELMSRMRRLTQRCSGPPRRGGDRSSTYPKGARNCHVTAAAERPDKSIALCLPSQLVGGV